MLPERGPHGRRLPESGPAGQAGRVAILDALRVPGWEGLPFARRLRVIALATIESALRGRASVPHRRSTEALDPVRRALAPLRLGRPSSASVPLDELPRPAPRGHGAPRASVIVPTRGGPALAQCLAAVRAYTRVPVELVVVDDASGAVDLHALPEGTRLVRLDARRGFVGAANAGARAAQTGLLVFLNDDVIVTPGWLEALEAALASPRAALVAPSSNDTGDAATIGARYRGLAELLRFSAERRGPPVEVDKLSLACAAIRKGTFDGVGGLDEGYGLGLFEDDELCRSLRARGGRILLVGDAYVHHHGSLTFDTLGSAARIARFEINRHRFEQRWRTRWRAP